MKVVIVHNGSSGTSDQFFRAYEILEDCGGKVMDKRKLFILCCVMLVVVLLMEPAFCGITDQQIKAASKSFTGAMNDWTPAVIGGGLLVSGMLIFANNYKAGLSGIAATAFIYAAKAFTGTGEACLLTAAPAHMMVVSQVQMAPVSATRAFSALQSSERYADSTGDVEAGIHKNKRLDCTHQHNVSAQR